MKEALLIWRQHSKWLGLAAWLFLAYPQADAASSSQLKCSAEKLEQKNCVLRAANYTIELADKKILLNDGTWRAVEEMPLYEAKSVQWDLARLRILQGRLLIELKMWDEPSGEAEIQSLHWFVLQADKGAKLERLLHQVISKRRKTSSGQGEAVKKVVLQDKVEPHGLKPIKDNKIHWWAGREKGELTRASGSSHDE